MSHKTDDELKKEFKKKIPLEVQYDIEDLYEYVKKSKKFIITKPLEIHKINSSQLSLNYSFEFETVDKHEYYSTVLDKKEVLRTPFGNLKTEILKFAASYFIFESQASMVFENNRRIYYIKEHNSGQELVEKILNFKAKLG